MDKSVHIHQLPYLYVWGNNPVRVQYRGQRCRVVVRGRMNTCLLEFEDGRRLVTSRNAIRRAR